MKTLITGANGFTGSHLVKALVEQSEPSHTIIALVRKTSDLSRLTPTNVQLAYGDITDRASLQSAMQGVDRVFHTAAYVELGIVDAARMERINVEGTRNVLEAAQAVGVQKMVYCSTIGVYGDTQGQIIDETFERQQQGFSSAYDSTKYQAQQIVDQFAVVGFPVVSVMPSGIFGADDPHFGPVMDTFLNGKLKVWAGGDRITGIVHVDDLVSAMILAADHAPSGSHYIISTGDLSTRAMFQFLSQETGIPAPTEVPQPVVRLVGNILEPIGHLLSWQPPISRERVHYIYDRCVRVSGDKARKELGWNPRSVEETLRQSLKR
ncbi:MAG: NAD-dependent epimerase/dehydratase family protein [Timaviella obliquedivisa GSE-PSE-MK23-08B]|jgi:nucleoside-diphosphate-sugar epimerase|nr:NAD-dependent epimerase/dehydratase family protein [Timaviella obliquedivisa GSE-PSE-MK23-08B]